jgi:nucleoside phosphorylase
MRRPTANDVSEPIRPVPVCDLLIFITTDTEQEALLWVSGLFGLTCRAQSDPELGDYFDLGSVGRERVLAVRTRMGTVDHRGATTQAVLFRAKTQARGLIAVGMAFGMSRKYQRFGDVLVSESLFPYDVREVVDSPAGPVPNYEKTKRRWASSVLVAMIDAEILRKALPFAVHRGLLLSGNARISSSAFRDDLAARIPPSGPIVGGDMEGVGLLAVAPADKPVWIVVKGISDFAEGDASHTDDVLRGIACRNAVYLVLVSILHAHEGR